MPLSSRRLCMGAGVQLALAVRSPCPRSDHHPTDAIAGMALGVLALWAAVFVLQTWSAVGDLGGIPANPGGRPGDEQRRADSGRTLTSIAVVAHAGKSLGGGLPGLKASSTKGITVRWLGNRRAVTPARTARRSSPQGRSSSCMGVATDTGQRCIVLWRLEIPVEFTRISGEHIATNLAFPG